MPSQEKKKEFLMNRNFMNEINSLRFNRLGKEGWLKHGLMRSEQGMIQGNFY